MAADYNLLIALRDFKKGDEYLLLDAILCGSCFADAGVAAYGAEGRRREFRRYSAKFYPNVLVHESPIPRVEKRLTLRMFSADQDDIMDQVLQSYGVRMTGIADVGGFALKEFSVADAALPTLALLCKGDVQPSRRVVADCAYRKWLSRRTHGDDMSDWLCAEAEMYERMERVVRGLV